MDTRVVIQRGKLITGGLCKRTVGNAPGGLIHIIWNDFGPDRCRRFLSNAQVLINSWIVYHGFTVGISDTVSDENTSRKIRTILDDSQNSVNKIMEDAQAGRLQSQPGKNMIESFEFSINVELNKARDNAGAEAIDSLSDTNNIKAMVLSGSKGAAVNISQIMSCVGQQNVEGKRIPFGFKNRTLPHFTKDDYGRESKGFVLNSYLTGLTPSEFFFHAMGGREGIIDTAVKTSETGYIQRRLIKSLEDVMVKYDGTVRNSMGHLLQFLYGEDGIAGENVEEQKISLLGKSDKAMIDCYQLINPKNDLIDEINKLKDFIDASIVEEIEKSVEKQYKIQKEYEDLVKFRDELRRDVFKTGDDKQNLPVNLDRLILSVKRRFNLDNNRISDLDPCYIIDEVNKLADQLIVVPGLDSVSIEAQLNGTKLFTIHLKTELASKKVICTDKLNKLAFDHLLGEISGKFNKSKVSPGEMVGAIAAQSIGEPATQMTLNTFHFAGVSSKNVTLGVPRLKEVINVAKTIKTPSVMIYLKEDIAESQEKGKEVHSNLQYTTLSSIADKVSIFYDPDPKESKIEEDNEFIRLHYQMEEDQPGKSISPWVIRAELSKNKMTTERVTMDLIKSKIFARYGTHLEIINSDDNAENLILRIRDIKEPNEEEPQPDPFTAMNNLKRIQNAIMNETSIKGIPDIKKVYMREINKTFINKEGEIKGSKKEWILETDGVNLKEVLLNPNVDHRRTYSNNINEIAEVLGIEAVRQSILNELRSVLKNYGIYVNYRHLSMLADLMTHRGILTSITRHGINRVESGPLRRCSFEETVEILLEAAAFAEIDCLKGITENIMFGQLAPLGTGCFDVLINKEEIKHSKPMQNIDEQEMMIGADDAPMGMDEGGATPGIYTPRPFTPGTYISTPDYRGGLSFTPNYGENLPGINPASPPYAITSPGYPSAANMMSPNYHNPSRYNPSSPTHPGEQDPNFFPTTPEHSGDIASPPMPSMQRYPYPQIGVGGVQGAYQGRMSGHLSPLYSPRVESGSPLYSPHGANSIPGSIPMRGRGTGAQYGPSTPNYNPNSPAYVISSPRILLSC